MHALVAGLGVAVCLLRWRPSRVEIRGPSMAPSLQEGDWALAVRMRSDPRPGDVVVVEHPGRPGFEMVKRVIAGPGMLAPNGDDLDADEFWIEGDRGDQSTDSRRFGPVRRRHLRARVRLVYWPADRRRLL